MDTIEVIESSSNQINIFEGSGSFSPGGTSLEIFEGSGSYNPSGTSLEITGDISNNINNVTIETVNNNVTIENITPNVSIDITLDSPTSLEVEETKPIIEIFDKTLISGALEFTYDAIPDTPFKKSGGKIGTNQVSNPRFELEVSGTMFSDEVSSSKVLTPEVKSAFITSSKLDTKVLTSSIGKFGTGTTYIDDNISTFSITASQNISTSKTIIAKDAEIARNLNVEGILTAGTLTVNQQSFTSISSSGNIFGLDLFVDNSLFADVVSSSKLIVKGDGTDDIMLINSGSSSPITINSEGIIVFDEFTYTPLAVEGGFLYSGSNFYIGLE